MSDLVKESGSLVNGEVKDLVSRQAVLDIIHANSDLDGNDAVVWIEKDIKSLPSVTQKTGRWIESNGVGLFICSECTEPIYPMPTCMGKPLMKYCPNCGCRMVEPQESEVTDADSD